VYGSAVVGRVLVLLLWKHVHTPAPLGIVLLAALISGLSVCVCVCVCLGGEDRQRLTATTTTTTTAGVCVCVSVCHRTNPGTRAEPQQIVAQRLLSCLQYPVPFKSSTEDLTRPTFGSVVK
jgi:Mg2+/citrate symporter